MNKKIIFLSTSLIFFILIFPFPFGHENIVLAAGLQCITVTGGCVNNNGQSPWNSPRAFTAICYQNINVAAVECPVGWHVIGGGCRQNGNSHISDSCPTNNPQSVWTGGSNFDESLACNDNEWSRNSNPPGDMYNWWFCNFDGGPTYEVAYAICCNI